MGFLRRLFGPKKKSSADSSSSSDRHHNWSLIRSLNDKNRLAFPNAPYGELDANKHAIAVAAATAAVAEAALAAAQAAAEVVRLTSGTGAGKVVARGTVASLSVEEWAALKIQSSFRGYLARRALRALKALVKLQALVRGHIVRKQMANMLRRMQTLVRLQARARATRGHASVSITKPSSLFQNPRSVSNTTYRDGIDVSRPKLGSNWLEHWMEDDTTWNNHGGYTVQPRTRQDDERSTKILEVDTWKPSKGFTRFDSPSKYSSKALNPVPSLSSEEALSMRSPQVAASAPSKRPGLSNWARRQGPFKPARSECSWSIYNGYSSHPNFMANTESSQAKVRSQSTPRQREFDRYGSAKRALPLQVSWDGGSLTNSDRSYMNRHLR